MGTMNDWLDEPRVTSANAGDIKIADWQCGGTGKIEKIVIQCGVRHGKTALLKKKLNDFLSEQNED
jgi:hypothetical protein